MLALDVVEVDVTDERVNVNDDDVTDVLAIEEMMGDIFRLSMIDVDEVVGVARLRPILAKLKPSELFSFPIRFSELVSGELITLT